jgi:ParB family chromosome partitioning protein
MPEEDSAAVTLGPSVVPEAIEQPSVSEAAVETDLQPAAAMPVAESTDVVQSDVAPDLEIELPDPDQFSRSPHGQLKYLPIEYLVRGAFQPRRDFDPAALEELAQSIQQQGLMQPIVVRSLEKGKYEIIAGERRWRACQQAGLETIPCLIKTVDDEAALAMALIENMQREDLNPMEEAAGLYRLHTEFELTHQQVAEVVGKSRSAVTNMLRLINLQPEVKVLVERGDLDMGHARALLSLPAPIQIQAAKTAVARGLSVRQMEAYVKTLMVPKQSGQNKTVRDPNIRDLERQIGETLGAKVKIQHSSKGKGKLVIGYTSLMELEGILEHITTRSTNLDAEPI